MQVGSSHDVHGSYWIVGCSYKWQVANYRLQLDRQLLSIWPITIVWTCIQECTNYL